MQSKGKDLSKLYNLRHEFTIIGLTGYLGAGCELVANQLKVGFNGGKDFTNPARHFKAGGSRFNHNAYRKHRIIYDYAEVNFKPYSIIQYRDIITLCLLRHPFEELIEFLDSQYLKNEFQKSHLESCFIPQAEKHELQVLKTNFNIIANHYKTIVEDDDMGNKYWRALYDFFFDNKDFSNLSEMLHKALGRTSELEPASKITHAGINYHKTFQVVATNLRRSGNPYPQEQNAFDTTKIFTIAETINTLIKSHRKVNERTQIVIDSLKNPLEIMFFKQRFAAFYTIAVNRKEDELDLGRFTTSKATGHLKKMREEEYEGSKQGDFSKLNISQCLQLADIHISFIDDPDLNDLKQNSNAAETPSFGWKDQLLKYISLIDHPGLVTPSPEERCMQLAFTAKHNSGCISRHVGAAITDENFSVRAIGWNNTPQGQVPCVLRNAQDLINKNYDLEAFTDYERDHDNERFTSALEGNFKNQLNVESANLKGRHACFCFKAIQNSIEDGKNQVHTRSLHAEENAFLQIVKYGGLGINGGKLFSTASPCELCAKKARQLGIKEIYYIDPYPGISNPHILNTGESKIIPKLFSGAIGSAYHWLYEPMMPYKDELTLILGNPISDLVKQYKNDLKIAQELVNEKENQIIKLNTIINNLTAGSNNLHSNGNTPGE